MDEYAIRRWFCTVLLQELIGLINRDRFIHIFQMLREKKERTRAIRFGRLLVGIFLRVFLLARRDVVPASCRRSFLRSPGIIWTDGGDSAWGGTRVAEADVPVAGARGALMPWMDRPPVGCVALRGEAS